jgi:hypothetical protein
MWAGFVLRAVCLRAWVKPGYNLWLFAVGALLLRQENLSTLFRCGPPGAQTLSPIEVAAAREDFHSWRKK